MDSKQDADAPRRYAILIGVDSYEGQPLTSCVRDVEAMRAYLATLPFAVGLQMLTAPTSEPSLSPKLVEHPSQWPTHSNVLSMLERVTVQAQHGEFVLIHFSGHGCRIPPPGGHLSMGDVGLVLLAEENSTTVTKESVLSGCKLAELIRGMVNKGVRVNLILDCYFSGGTSRLNDVDPVDIRYLDWAYIYRAPISENGIRPTRDRLLDHKLVSPFSRDASALPNWMIDPKGYTTLTACSAGETAGVIIASEDKQKYGVLSYFLTQTLRELDYYRARRTLQEIYNQLCLKFLQKCEKRQPALYGDGDAYFLGPPAMAIMTTPIPAARFRSLDTSTLWLQAGQAHGVQVGDQFRIERFYGGETAQFRACARKVGPLTSQLEVLDPSWAESSSMGWSVIPPKRLSLRQHRVRVSTQLPEWREWQEAAKKCACLEIAFTDIEDEAFVFHVVLNSEGQLNILDLAHTTIPGLPLTRSQSAERNLAIVKQLVQFEYLKRLHSPSPAAGGIQDSFRVTLQIGGTIFAPGTKIIDARHTPKGYGTKKHPTDVVSLKLENHCQSPRYFQVLDLGPQWQVDVLWKEGDKLDTECGSKERLFTMSIPDAMIEQGYRECRDILKVFVTTKRTTFSWLKMSRMGVGMELAPLINTTNREDEGSEGWAVVDFHIRITKGNLTG